MTVKAYNVKILKKKKWFLDMLAQVEQLYLPIQGSRNVIKEKTKRI